MNHIKIIKSQQDHEQALSCLMSLMDANPAEGSCEADEIDVLALLIESYEKGSFPMDLPSPIDAIKFRMDQQGLIRKDMITYMGSASKVTEVLNGTRGLSLNMIRRLSEGLGIPAEVLIRDTVQQLAEGSEVSWNAFPVSEMYKHGYFGASLESTSEVKEYAAEYVTTFLSSVSNGFNLQPAHLRSSAHMRSNRKTIDNYALWAWQVRVLQKVQEGPQIPKYKQGTVTQKWMNKLAQLSWSDKGPLLAKEYLNKYGIYLIIEPHLKKTYLDGAASLAKTNNPVVALTLRHDRIDNFWFTLMHELAHVSLHIDSKDDWYLDDIESESKDIKEQEADALARDALISNGEMLRETQTVDDVRSMAKKLNIHSDIIAGRLRFDTDDHTLFGTAFRSKIKFVFGVL